MKVKITRPDGTVVEIEGTSEECAPWLGTVPPAQLLPVYVPYTPIVTQPLTWPEPYYPTWYSFDGGAKTTISVETFT